MTTSLKKAPEVTLWGFRFVYRLDTISFLATAIIAYASCLFKIHIFYFWLFLAYKLSTIFYFFIIVLLLYNRDIKSGLCAQTRASSLAGGMPVW